MITKTILENCLILMMAASFFAWCISFRKLWRREPLVAAAERSPVPWNALDVLLSMIFFIAIQLITMLMVRQSLEIGGDEKTEDFTPHQIAMRIDGRARWDKHCRRDCDLGVYPLVCTTGAAGGFWLGVPWNSDRFGAGIRRRSSS